jgi:peptidoglycan/LPS O-acetylase OafA/YrhL
VGLPQTWWPTNYIVLFTTQDLFWAAVSITLIGWGALGVGGPIGRFLGSKMVGYLGKISYGLYIYHGFAPVLVPWVFRELGVGYPQVGYTRATLLVSISLASAMISWHIFELPINSFKKRFPYPAQQET